MPVGILRTAKPWMRAESVGTGATSLLPRYVNGAYEVGNRVTLLHRLASMTYSATHFVTRYYISYVIDCQRLIALH
jgi:hypothetical protein